MATRGEWIKYINVLHELALVEDDLREYASREGFDDATIATELMAGDILFERFGVDG